MAITKQTTNYTVVVTVHGVESTYDVSGKDAYAALMDFKAGNAIKVTDGEGDIVYIPFHAITTMTVSKSSASETIEDAFCVADSADDGGEDGGGK